MLELNVSKDTTLREIIDIKGIDKEVFKPLNISLTFGVVSHVEYCINMFNFPTFEELDKYILSSLSSNNTVSA